MYTIQFESISIASQQLPSTPFHANTLAVTCTCITDFIAINIGNH